MSMHICILSMFLRNGLVSSFMWMAIFLEPLLVHCCSVAGRRSSHIQVHACLHEVAFRIFVVPHIVILCSLRALFWETRGSRRRGDPSSSGPRQLRGLRLPLVSVSAEISRLNVLIYLSRFFLALSCNINDQRGCVRGKASPK